MQKPIGLFVTNLLTSEVTTIDMFMWNRQARAHDKAAVLAAMYLSKEFQEFMNKLAFPLPMDHVKAWFCADAEPLPPKKRTELALQKRAEAGLTANTWGGSALFGARLSQRLSSVRVSVVRCLLSFESWYDPLSSISLITCVFLMQLDAYLGVVGHPTFHKKADQATRMARGEKAVEWLRGNAYRVSGSNPVGNSAFVAAVEAVFTAEPVKLGQLAIVSYKVNI